MNQFEKHLPTITNIVWWAEEQIKQKTGFEIKLRYTDPLQEDKIDKVIRTFCDAWEVQPEYIIKKGGNCEKFMMKKILCMFLRIKYPKFSLKELGRRLGYGEDHTNVIHHTRSGYNMMKTQDEKFMPYYLKVKHFFENEIQA
jgi:chromosomal replication initiation ATPase DnaA